LAEFHALGFGGLLFLANNGTAAAITLAFWFLEILAMLYSSNETRLLDFAAKASQ
jgi:hypothetical protein